MKKTVITWDASFRESFHTLDFFLEAVAPRRDAQLVWVEYHFAADDTRQRIDELENAHLLELGRPRDELWSLSRMMNSGLNFIDSDLYYFVDGDILPERGFIDKAEAAYRCFAPHALYIRRWDEPGPVIAPPTLDTSQLAKVCRPAVNPNYAPCLVIGREQIRSVGGWNEHAVFDGPGGAAGELAIRLRNAGIPHVWNPDIKLYHPWHALTGSTRTNPLVKHQLAIMQRMNQAVTVQPDLEQITYWLKESLEQETSSENPGANKAA
jgi:hypothetical protein